MNILFVTLHVRRSAQAIPLAAACLAAALPPELRQSTRLLDVFPDEDPGAVIERILQTDPHLVSMPLYLWNRRQAQELARELKNRRPAIYLVAGGPEASADPDPLLPPGPFDALVRGEGERTFAALALSLRRGVTPQPAPGLCLGRQGAAAKSPAPETITDLNSLPSPWLSGTLTPSCGGGALWEISRGCPFNCAYCYDARGDAGVRHLSMERIEAELDLFVKSGVSQIWVLDSTFNYPPERGRKLLRLLAKKAPHIHFHLEAKADFLDRETARLLTSISCSLQLGLQSIDPGVLRLINRSIDPDRFRRQARLLSKEGVAFGLDLIYGLPGDDYQGFCNSLKAALEMEPNHIDMFPLAVLPGTPLHGKREALGLQAQNTPPYEVQATATLPPEDMERCRILAAATDLFYNLGRAMAFFPTLVAALNKNPVQLLVSFAEWVQTEGAVPRQRLLDPTAWSSAAILDLQERFVEHHLRRAKRTSLLPAAQDLMRYHFHYAETLLGPETHPCPKPGLNRKAAWQTPLSRGGNLRLVHFNFEILELMEMTSPDLEQISALFRPLGSFALFLRRGNEVICESLSEDFAKLMRESDGKRSPAEIFAGSIPKEEGMELVDFALVEGLLLPGHKRGVT